MTTCKNCQQLNDETEIVRSPKRDFEPWCLNCDEKNRSWDDPSTVEGREALSPHLRNHWGSNMS